MYIYINSLAHFTNYCDRHRYFQIFKNASDLHFLLLNVIWQPHLELLALNAPIEVHDLYHSPYYFHLFKKLIYVSWMLTTKGIWQLFVITGKPLEREDSSLTLARVLEGKFVETS